MLESLKNYRKNKQAEESMTPEQAQSSKQREALITEMKKLGFEGANFDVKEKVWAEKLNNTGNLYRKTFKFGEYNFKITLNGKKITGNFCMNSSTASVSKGEAMITNLNIIRDDKEDKPRVSVDGKKLSDQEAKIFVEKTAKMIILAKRESDSSKEAKETTNSLPTPEEKLKKQEEEARTEEQIHKEKEKTEAELARAKRNVDNIIDSLQK